MKAFEEDAVLADNDLIVVTPDVREDIGRVRRFYEHYCGFEAVDPARDYAGMPSWAMAKKIGL